MLEGYVVDSFPEEIPGAYDFAYAVGLFGTERLGTFDGHWDNIKNIGHGIIHRPYLTAENDVYDNVSAMLWLCQETEDFNDMPFIVDIFEAAGNQRLSFDHLRIYAGYVGERFPEGTKKPLLRMNLLTWTNWYNGNPTEAMRLLNGFEPLLAQFEVEKPSELIGFGKVHYWEWANGKIAHDETGEWLVSPVPPEEPPVEPPDDPDPPEEPPVEPPTNPVKKWRINLSISGEIEAID